MLARVFASVFKSDSLEACKDARRILGLDGLKNAKNDRDHESYP